GRRHEEGERHHQVGGIQRLAAVVLHERLSPLVPALRNNVLVDLVADFEPAISWGRERALVREANCAIERDPTHELRIQKFPLTAAYLPHLSFPKIPSARIRALRQNQSIILGDACMPSAA